MGISLNIFAQSPHGASLRVDCASCHTSAGWEISADYWNSVQRNSPTPPGESSPAIEKFKHSSTGFDLDGRHENIDCKSCHQSLVFSEASSDCISCHLDIHQQTVGTNCARCHSTANWLVDQVTSLHQENGFPLFGQHAVVSCSACHQSETTLRFDRLGNDCVNCHIDVYQATTQPNHAAAGYSTNCVDCHDSASPDWFWRAGTANHLFFPLTEGHRIDDCMQCHAGGNFVNTPRECYACHETNYKATTNPNHVSSNFSTDCTQCHTTATGWPSDNYTQHDQDYFPIFSGQHKGAWSECIDCHTTANNYTAFSCVQCHEHNNESKLSNKHDDVQGYSFESNACYTCHPKG